MNQEILNAVKESPENIANLLKKYFSDFKDRKLIVESPEIRYECSTYSGMSSLIRLEDAENGNLFVDNERYWCGSCPLNCQENLNRMNFTRLSEEDTEKLCQFLKNDRIRWRNVRSGTLLWSLGYRGTPEIEITTYRMWDIVSDKKWSDSWSEIDVYNNGYLQTSPNDRLSYEIGAELIRSFRTQNNLFY